MFATNETDRERLLALCEMRQETDEWLREHLGRDLRWLLDEWDEPLPPGIEDLDPEARESLTYMLGTFEGAAIALGLTRLELLENLDAALAALDAKGRGLPGASR